MSIMAIHHHRFLTIAEAAELLRVSERTIRRWIEDASVPYLKLPGGGYRLPEGQMLASMSGSQELAASFLAGGGLSNRQLIEAARQQRLVAGADGQIVIPEEFAARSAASAMRLAGAAEPTEDESQRAA